MISRKAFEAMFLHLDDVEFSILRSCVELEWTRRGGAEDSMGLNEQERELMRKDFFKNRVTVVNLIRARLGLSLEESKDLVARSTSTRR